MRVKIFAKQAKMQLTYSQIDTKTTTKHLEIKNYFTRLSKSHIMPNTKAYPNNPTLLRMIMALLGICLTELGMSLAVLEI